MRYECIIAWLTVYVKNLLTKWTGSGKIVAIGHEIAVLLMYLVRLADKLDIDLIEAAQKKLLLNEQKYPDERVVGDSQKYSDY